MALLTLRLVGDFTHYAGAQGVLTLGLIGAAALLEGVGLVLLIPILVVVMQGDAAQHGPVRYALGMLDRLGVRAQSPRLAVLLGGFLLLIAVRAAVVFLRDITSMRLQTGFVETVSRRVTGRLVTAPWEVVSRLQHARVTQMLGGEIQQVSGATNVLVQSSISVIMVVIMTGLVVALSPWLAVLLLTLLGLAAFAMGPVLMQSFSIGQATNEGNLRLVSLTARFLGGLKLAISHNLQESFLAEFEAAFARMNRTRLALTQQQSARRVGTNLLFAGLGAAYLFVGFTLFAVPPAALVTSLLLLTRLNGPVTQLQQGAQTLVQALPAYHRVKALEAELSLGASPPPPPSPAGGPLTGPILFRQVGFRHPGADRAATIRALDLVLERRSFVGVTGASGAGKTTFADLLSGLTRPEVGKISIGDTPLQGAALTEWRNRMSYVAQDPFLFHDTLRRNLLWAAPGANEAMIWEALRAAEAEALVGGLEHGLETVVGERGSFVSGGERQRLAVARAMLRRPTLLILDEATNAIDVAAEARLFTNLRRLSPRPTVVVIAHRMETLGLCDEVLTLEDGCFLPRPAHAATAV